MDTVLVVGGAGFLGSHAIRRLAACGHRVWATHTLGKAPPAIPEAQWVPSDLASPNATAAFPERCDHVVFLAQSRRYRDFPAGADNVFAVNLGGMMQALHYALRSRSSTFILASTGSVYSDVTRPAREADAIDLQAARNFYVATKLAAETLLAPFESLLPIVQLRLFLPYGAGQNPDMLFPQLVQRVKEGRSIFLHGRDGMRANPIYAGDVAEAIRRCLGVTTGGTFNLAGPEEHSLRAIGHAIGRTLGREPQFETRPDERPPVLVGRTEALAARLGWTPPTTLDAGLREWLAKENLPLAA